MIKTIAVDDEWHNLEEVCELIRQTGFMCVAGRYQNPLDALSELEKIQPKLRSLILNCRKWTELPLRKNCLRKIHPF